MRGLPRSASLQHGAVENDSGTTSVNLLVHLINELYFVMDDIETAAQAGTAGAVAAEDGREYLNAYVTIVNFPLNECVGDKFPTVPLGRRRRRLPRRRRPRARRGRGRGACCERESRDLSQF